MSQSLIDMIAGTARSIVDRSDAPYKNPTVCNTFVNGIYAPGSPLNREMLTVIDQATYGRWKNGINPSDVEQILRPWIRKVLSDLTIQQGGMQQQPNVYYPQQQQGYTYPPPQNDSVGYIYHSVGGNRDTSQQQPVSMPVSARAENPTEIRPASPEVSMQAFHDPNTINVELLERPLHVREDPTGIVKLGAYREDTNNRIRLSSTDVTMVVAENNINDAAAKAIKNMPSDVSRGIYANVVSYKELLHIPMKTETFRKLTEKLFEVSGLGGDGVAKGNNWWRDVVGAMGSLTISEYKALETVLLTILNPLIFRLLRTSQNAFIAGIEELKDLHELDDPRSKLVVTQHTHYLHCLNAIVCMSFQQMLDPRNLVGPDDKNIGDFIHCDQIEFYRDGRSKYDYGTFDDVGSRKAFINEMMETNTVLRVPRKFILTNAFDTRMVGLIRNYRGEDQLVINKINNLGCKLIQILVSAKANHVVDGVVCLGDTKETIDVKQLINVGCTLDGDVVLLR